MLKDLFRLHHMLIKENQNQKMIKENQNQKMVKENQKLIKKSEPNPEKKHCRENKIKKRKDY